MWGLKTTIDCGITTSEMADGDKKKRGNEPPEGFFSNIFRPWKRQRVTLTKIRKGLEPTRKARSKKTAKEGAKKTIAKQRSPEKGSPGKATEQKPGKLTAKQRQVNELKTLAKIGRRDPERLASIITKMLMEEEEREQTSRLKFEQLIWEKARKKDSEEG